MTIEFHCPTCSKLLRTADDKAGVRAKCPDCGTPVTVPSPDDVASAAADTAADTGESSGPPPIPARPTKFCPMCGESIPFYAARCQFCGEELPVAGRAPSTQPIGTIVPTEIGVSDVIDRAWAIFKAQLGLVLGFVLAMYGINFGLSFGSQIIFGIISAAAPKAGPILVVSMISMQFAMNAVSFFLTIGVCTGLLKVARGQPTEIGDLFRGGKYFLRAIGIVLLMGAAIGAIMLVSGIPMIVATTGMNGNDTAMIVGICSLCVGGAAVLYGSIRLHPMFYYLVDQDTGVVETFTGTWAITSNNVLSLIGLGIISMLCMLAGFLACFVGVIFALPFVFFVQAVAYCAMTGQPTARTA